MTKTDDGGPALPEYGCGNLPNNNLQNIIPNFQPSYNGMSLRDWFAGQAMNGILCYGADWRTRNADGDLINQDQVEDLAIVSYEIADAMLKERSKGALK